MKKLLVWRLFCQFFVVDDDDDDDDDINDTNVDEL